MDITAASEFCRALSEIVDERDLLMAERLAEESDQQVSEVLLKLGLTSADELARVISKHTGTELVGLEYLVENAAAASPASPIFLQKSCCVLLQSTDEYLFVAMADPSNQFVVKALKCRDGRNIKAFTARATDIFNVLARLYPQLQMREPTEVVNEYDSDEVQHLRDLASEAPVILQTQKLIIAAIARKASDIHIEPMDDRLSIRYRIDGQLVEAESIPKSSKAALVSRLKILAQLNIAERRLPQDGRMRLTVDGEEIEFRVASSPTFYGESVVLRILDRRDVSLDFESLGFHGVEHELILKALAQPHGVILVTGPTGSGKTTTLYAALKHLNKPHRKILTAEDPIEYTLERVNQTQIKPQIGHDFANALRSFLRQDPDVIMVGEIRDRETAAVAVQASLTGHLLLSTLHTNSAIGAVVRLLDMGVEDYLLASTLSLVVGQRLVRKLCQQCRMPQGAASFASRREGSEHSCGVSATGSYKAVGCAACNGSGYQGRVAIAEILVVDEEVRSLVQRRASEAEIEQVARRRGFKSLQENGLSKVANGETTLEEVLRVTQSS